MKPAEAPDPDYAEAADHYVFLCRKFRERPVIRGHRLDIYGNHAADLLIRDIHENLTSQAEDQIK